MNAFEPVVTCAGIVVPSLLIVLAIRRWFERVPAWVVATLFAVVLVVTGRTQRRAGQTERQLGEQQQRSARVSGARRILDPC